MKIEPLLFFIFACFLMACGPYKEFERTPEHERHVTKVRADRYKKHSFVGKWMEYKRTRKKREIELQDALMYDFYGDSSVNVYSRTGRIKKVQSGKKKKHGFYVGDTFYKSFYMRNGIMILGRGKIKHYLHKVDNFDIAPVAKVIPSADGAQIGPLDALFFQGEWKIYKKTDPNFSRQKTYLHKLEIGQHYADGTYKIKAFYNTSGKLVNDSGSLSIKDQTITLAIMNQTKSYTILGAENDEMILKDGRIVYFFKKIAE